MDQTNESNFKDDEVYEMPSEDFVSTVMDLGTAINESKEAITLFCNNNFDRACHLFEPWVNTSMYHALGNVGYLFIEAVLTYDQLNIQKAIQEIDRTIKLCDTYRRKQTYLRTIKKFMNFSITAHFSWEEIHAELVNAELLSLKSMLTFLDEKSNTFVGFIKAGYKLRAAFSAYKDCEVLLNYLQANHQNHDINFETGVRIGIGCFNLVISHLPTKIIRLLEVVGFSGDKQVGMSEIMKCHNLSEGLRNIGSIIVLLLYNLIMIYFLGNSDGDLEMCENILNVQLQQYPASAVFLFFKGRLEFLKGHIHQSISWHVKSWKSQSYWPQLHHFSFWDIMWCHIIVQDWKQAQHFADLLLKNSRWSRTVFCYQKACVMLMRYTELTDAEKEEIDTLMADIPKYKQRIAGKSIPVEKFCVKKSERYKIQNKTLVLPVYELLFVWNLFKPLGKSKEFCAAIYSLVVKERNCLSNNLEETKSPYFFDNQALLLFLESICLIHMNKPKEAEVVLKSVIALEKRIKDDFYIIPYSYVELANISINQGDTTLGIKMLENVKTSYTGYSLENRVHFQIHSALQELKK